MVWYLGVLSCSWALLYVAGKPWSLTSKNSTSLLLFSPGQPPGVWTGRGCVATGCTSHHAHPELHPPPGLLQAVPGSFKAKDSFAINFNQPQMWSLISGMPTAVGPTHATSACLHHTYLSYYKKEITKAAKSQPPFTMVPSYTTLTSKNNKKNPKTMFYIQASGKTLFQKPLKELSILRKNAWWNSLVL